MSACAKCGKTTLLLECAACHFAAEIRPILTAAECKSLIMETLARNLQILTEGSDPPMYRKSDIDAMIKASAANLAMVLAGRVSR